MASSMTTVLPLPVGADKTTLSSELKAIGKHLDCTALKVGNGKREWNRSWSSVVGTRRMPWTIGGSWLISNAGALAGSFG